MLSARALLHPRQRPWLPLAIAAGIVLLPINSGRDQNAGRCIAA